MTQTVDTPIGLAPAARRTQLDLTAQQLRAIEALNQDRRAIEDAAVAGASREARMDLARSLEVLRREHEALISRVDAQLRSSGAQSRSAGGRLLLAHRNEWFLSKVSTVLHEHGMEVVACLDNGADAVGAALAEQPDLVLVEDKIAMISGEEVVRQVRRHCPDTVVTAQVDYGDRVGALLDAGAQAVFTRQVPPAEVAEKLRELLAAHAATS